MEDYRSLLKLCQGRELYVQAHNFPDPDALASGHGLCRFLAAHGHRPTLCYDGLLDKRAGRRMVELFSIDAVPLAQLPPLGDEAMVICVDSQKGNANLTPLAVEVSACIDHHPTFVPAQYDYCDIRKAGSCSTMIAQYFQQAGLPCDEDTASALLYGIKMDTRQFARGVTTLDIEMFKFLNQYCDGQRLERLASNRMAFADLRAYASALETIQIYGSVGFAQIEIPCADDLIAMISDFFLSLDEIELSVAYSIREDGVKFSVRSKTEQVHVGEWIRRALQGLGSGGGHAYMAGGMIPPELIPALGPYPDETVRDRFLAALPVEG